MKKLWNQYSYAIILIVLSCITAMVISFHINSDDTSKYMKVTVSDGDSLWKMSEKYSGEHSLSNEEFVSWVKSHNDIEEDHIYPGQEIVIPVSKETPDMEVPAPTQFASAPGN